MKKGKSIIWRHVDLKSLNLRKLKVSIIGGTGGIGRSLAHYMAKQCAEVLVVGRTLKDKTILNISFVKADLSRLADARRVAGELPTENLDTVIMTRA